MTYKQLTHNMKIICPKYDNDGKDLTNHIIRLKADMADSYGGVTCYDAKGLWINNNGDIMEDDNIILESFSIKPITHTEASHYAAYVIVECNQLAATIIVDDKMILFERD